MMYCCRLELTKPLYCKISIYNNSNIASSSLDTSSLYDKFLKIKGIR